MTSTGITRRVDDLGRVVIPKEIRRSLGINEGDPLEFSVADGVVSLRRVVEGQSYVDRRDIVDNPRRLDDFVADIVDEIGDREKAEEWLKIFVEAFEFAVDEAFVEE